jgi:hypothetical protein
MVRTLGAREHGAQEPNQDAEAPSDGSNPISLPFNFDGFNWLNALLIWAEKLPSEAWSFLLMGSRCSFHWLGSGTTKTLPREAHFVSLFLCQRIRFWWGVGGVAVVEMENKLVTELEQCRRWRTSVGRRISADDGDSTLCRVT